MSSRLYRVLHNPLLIVGHVLRYNLPNLIKNDEKYIRAIYFCSFHQKINLDNPQKLTEKQQWMKLYDRQPLYTRLVDKYEAKKWAEPIIGKEHIIPTLGVWNHFEEINFDELPEQFVLKCNHDCGSIVIVKDKNTFDKNAAKKKLEKGLKRNYYHISREWPYKNVKPLIIAEKYMETPDGDLPDYKFFCFNGKPTAMFVATDRQIEGVETKFDFFDMEFNHLPVISEHPNAKPPYIKPNGFELMKELAAKLSAGIPQVRVDFYDINGQIYFGEMTFFHWGGFQPFEPEEWDYKWGQMVTLPTVKTIND